jgi:hypothetical protein
MTHMTHMIAHMTIHMPPRHTPGRVQCLLRGGTDDGLCLPLAHRLTRHQLAAGLAKQMTGNMGRRGVSDKARPILQHEHHNGNHADTLQVPTTLGQVTGMPTAGKTQRPTCTSCFFTCDALRMEDTASKMPLEARAVWSSAVYLPTVTHNQFVAVDDDSAA